LPKNIYKTATVPLRYICGERRYHLNQFDLNSNNAISGLLFFGVVEIHIRRISGVDIVLGVAAFEERQSVVKLRKRGKDMQRDNATTQGARGLLGMCKHDFVPYRNAATLSSYSRSSIVLMPRAIISNGAA